MTFMHFGVKCKGQHLFQELLFPSHNFDTIQTDRQEVFVLSKSQLSLRFHSYTFFVTKVVGFVDVSIKPSPFFMRPKNLVYNNFRLLNLSTCA